MILSQIIPPKFSSNIYVHREVLSEYLTNYSAFRLEIASLIFSPDDIAQLDNYLIKAHYNYLKVCRTIELTERDYFPFSS